ncbi:glycoside hydrolase family 3 protein [Agromyces seonyuensis]|uniref:Family 3 glycosyl hydrolase n=1 Tax=Agromyces seonyuensis TaxID=2662446 RepID=A0A6I4NYJ2_9MICO|nr:glycoside hydrolase family 3 C-terminal domain-containing protein [Agromyces seonyuensis]MWB99440.1 family 3 glycosyl hydrolase [Agromyces seonyuensis]
MSEHLIDPDSAFGRAVDRIRNGADPQHEARALVDSLTDDERLWLLDGDGEFWSGMGEMGHSYNVRPIVMGEIARIGLPGLRFSDGPRGVVMGESTAFPVAMARGATWNVDLEERVGEAIGAEMRVQGGNLFAGVCINLPRHPAWGRVQETYSEDPLILGEMGAAVTRGVRRHGMAMVKHFALNSMENARFAVDVTVDDASLHEVYLPHFRRTIESGAEGVMASYNSVNGEWAGQNENLLTDILRDEWGFDGVTITDFIFGLRDTAKSLRAGLDVEAPLRQQRANRLPDDLAEGRASWADVDRAALRIIATQLRFYSADRAPSPASDVVFSPAHRALAREVAREAIVLLQNEPVGERPLLPLDAAATRRIALVGSLADVANTGDKGSSTVRTPHVITPLEGLREFLPDARIDVLPGDDLAATADAAADADVAVVVVGYTAADEGEYLGAEGMSTPEVRAVFPPFPAGVDLQRMGQEHGNVMGDADGGDRLSLRLADHDVALIRATAAANPRTVVVIVSAGAVITEEWRDEVPAVVLGWYSGSEGGAALAEVLFGATDAVGRLPYSIPTDEAHLPFFDRDATAITYDRWFGQRLLDRDGHAAAFPLGFGLSYTDFTIDALEILSVEGEEVVAVATVANTGARRGRHVVQLYARLDEADFPERVLIGFAPVWVDAGGHAEVRIVGSLRPTQRWHDGAFHAPAGSIVIEAAAHAGDPAAVRRSEVSVAAARI